MLTLREFITNMRSHEHYRVYQPNRDCLVFESYFKVHSACLFNKETAITKKWYYFNDKYYKDNDFCDDARTTRPIDEETEAFLEIFGDHEVIRLDCSSFRPYKMWQDANGKLQFDYSNDPMRPHNDYIECFDIFIK